MNGDGIGTHKTKHDKGIPEDTPKEGSALPVPEAGPTSGSRI